MPIIESSNGILRTHTVEYENIDGIIKEQTAVTANDGGVMRKVFASGKVKLEGITPLVSAEDHIVITESGSGTISLPAGARLILGSGGWKRNSGYVAEFTLTEPIINATFTTTIGRAYSGNSESGRKNSTKIVIDKRTYSCGSVQRTISSKWGPIGGYGGVGEASGDEEKEASDGEGAGGAGGKQSDIPVCKGGNNGGYGNYGGNGGSYYNRKVVPSTGGSSGSGSTRGSSGGGGGYAAGGGEPAYEATNDEAGTSASINYLGDFGQAGAGIIVIEF